MHYKGIAWNGLGGIALTVGRVAAFVTFLTAVALTGGYAQVALAREVSVSPTILVDVPEVFTISTLGGCDEDVVTVKANPNAASSLPLRTSGIVKIVDQTGYAMDTKFMPSVDFSGVSQIQTRVRLCLPPPVEVVEPFAVDVTVFSSGCGNVANVCLVVQRLTLVREAPVPPDPPSSVTASALTNAARIAWSPPTRNGGAPITGYTVTASPGGQTCSTTGALSCSVTGLTSETAYTFTVTATNAAGTSVPSAPSAAVTPAAPIAPPSVVNNLSVIPGKGSIRATWSAPSDMGGATSVTYQYQVGRQAWKSTSATSVTVRGKKGVRITVSVRAVNQAGSGPSISVIGVPR